MHHNAAPTPPSLLPFVYFGTPRFATIVLDELEAAGYTPALVVTAPDKPKGRKLLLTPSEVKVWADERQIPTLTPSRLRDPEILAAIAAVHAPLFIVAAYGKIIPKAILDLPEHGCLNVHPSLLPKFRGPSPIESALLSTESETGVSIMLLDEETDHGPIVAQEVYAAAEWPMRGSVLTDALAHAGGKLLAQVVAPWVATHTAVAQDHSQATFTKKIVKEDGLIDLAGDALENYKKIRAFDEWPGAYFFTERNGKQIRVRVTDADYSDGVLTITRVIPEGKKEMPYADFLRGGH